MRIFADLSQLASEAAAIFVHQAQIAILERGRFIVALAGGNTPRKLYELLAAEPYRSLVEWSRCFFILGDERFVPPSDPLSNEAMIRDSLLLQLPVPESNFFPAYREGSVAEAAQAYEKTLRELLGSSPIDLVLLGMGPDGHTASLFPGDPSVYEEERIVVASVASANTRDRITLTPPILRGARQVVFMIAGADKAPALRRLIDGEIDLDQTPSQAVGRFAKEVVFLVDEAAANGPSI